MYSNILTLFRRRGKEEVEEKKKFARNQARSDARARVYVLRLFGGAYRWPTDGQVPRPPRRCPRLKATTRPCRGHAAAIGRAGRRAHASLVQTGCASDYLAAAAATAAVVLPIIQYCNDNIVHTRVILLS